MNKKELLQAVQHMRDDDEIVIVLKQPSVGGTANVKVQSVSDGFDWDNGKILIHTETPVVTQQHLDRIQEYCRAYEKLLYLYAMENDLSFNGIPLQGSKSCPKGSTARVFKEYMKKHVNKYLGNEK
jgi:hypothetical protein